MRTPDLERPHRTGVGVQRLYRFPNGFGASVVKFSLGPMGGSYGAEEGLWEMAVLKYEGEGLDSFDLRYDTPVTDDVLGYLTDEDVDARLSEIEALEP